MYLYGMGSGESKSLPRRMRGVTLIELMIVVVIVGILAAVAYPSYRNQVQQTRRTDGKAALLEAAQQLERCFSRYNTYTHASCAADVDIDDAGRLSAEEWYLIEYTARTASSYTLRATPQGAQAADTQCTVLTLTHTGVQGASGSAPDRCW